MSIEEAIEAAVRKAVAQVVKEEVEPAVERAMRRLGVVEKADTYLTTKQAAGVAGVEPDAIRQWVAKGRLTRYGDGHLRVKRSELVALLERQGVKRVTEDEIQSRVDKAVMRLVK